MKNNPIKRVAIYLADFNPISLADIQFALKAKKQAKLNEVYFLPERIPRNSRYFEHIGHRQAMIRRALKPYSDFQVMEIEDSYFSISRSLPKLKKKFSNDQLIFLINYSTYCRLMEMKYFNQLLDNHLLVVGLSSKNETNRMNTAVANKNLLTVYQKNLSNQSQINKKSGGILVSVARYCKENWLYETISKYLD